MAKLSNYKGSVDLISGLRPQNNGDFPLMQAHDIVVDESGTRLDEKLKNIGTSGSGGSGSSVAIIDVNELPTVDINTKAIYRLTSASFYYNTVKADANDMYCYVVDSLPSNGEQAYNPSGTPIVVAYYNKADGSAYGYVTSALSSSMGVPVGWYPATTLFGAFNNSFSGVVTSKTEMRESNTCYLFVESYLCAYNDGWHRVISHPREETAMTLRRATVSSFEDAVRLCAGVVPFKTQLPLATSTGSIGIEYNGGLTLVSPWFTFIDVAATQYGVVVNFNRYDGDDVLKLAYTVLGETVTLIETVFIKDGTTVNVTNVDTSRISELVVYYFD